MDVSGLGSALARIQQIQEASVALVSFADTLSAYQGSSTGASSGSPSSTTSATSASVSAGTVAGAGTLPTPTAGTLPAATAGTLPVPSAGTIPADDTAAIDPDWAESLPPQGQRWAGDIEAAASRQGLDPRLLASLVWAESSFNSTAVSSAGAIGLTQLMPATAAGLNVDPWDPQQNLMGGARFLGGQLDRFGSVELALAAYNAGPGRVEEAGGVPPETRDYVSRVLGYYHMLGGTS